MTIWSVFQNPVTNYVFGMHACIRIFCLDIIQEMFEPVKFAEGNSEHQRETYMHFVHLLAECEGKYACQGFAFIYVYIYNR